MMQTFYTKRHTWFKQKFRYLQHSTAAQNNKHDGNYNILFRINHYK